MEFINEIFSNLISVFKTFEIKDVIDIIAITFIVFSLFKLVRETRAEQLLKGILMLLVVYFLSSIFKLMMLTSLIKILFEFGVILLVVIFQPEIRKALEQIGRSKFSVKSLNFITQSFKSEEWTEAQKKAIVCVADAAIIFGHSKTGALIVFERSTMLSDIAATGTILNSEPSVSLFGNIFFNKAPLHDGASIMRDGKILASGCILPLSKNPNIDSSLGTRHRAALGMSEDSDAVVVVVSEETGNISVAVKGTLTAVNERENLINDLEKLLLPTEEEKTEFLQNFLSRRKEKKK